MGSHKRYKCVKKVDILCGKKEEVVVTLNRLVYVCHRGNRTTRKTARQTETKRTALSQAQISRRRPGSTGSRTLSPVRHNAYVDVTVNVEHSNMGADQQQPMLATDENYQMIE